ncbi:phosphoribosyltransferase family protein [Nesterenkonia sp. NBAIMH1]|uniref:phosphoribosyltransferase family protein n=1 Tax=Nesterenkonia sp. NBAIMH1 TaxID=2600320 RepID=UPI0011B488F7|nr:phosphoribosyltransferase family protein [Nesterenkonia sp. NBAIMH1]
MPRLTAEGRRVLPGSTVLLADDVLTTGSTLKRLSMALSAAGAQVRGGVVLAAAAR